MNIAERFNGEESCKCELRQPDRMPLLSNVGLGLEIKGKGGKLGQLTEFYPKLVSKLSFSRSFKTRSSKKPKSMSPIVGHSQVIQTSA